MPAAVQYYFAPQSPWTYLGHARFLQIAQAARAEIEVLPVDYGAIFPASGGLPLAKRAPQRQAYRLVELRRFAQWLGLPLNLQPAFFPVKGDASAQLIVAVDQHDGSDAALALTGSGRGASDDGFDERAADVEAEAHAGGKLRIAGHGGGLERGDQPVRMHVTLGRPDRKHFKCLGHAVLGLDRVHLFHFAGHGMFQGDLGPLRSRVTAPSSALRVRA